MTRTVDAACFRDMVIGAAAAIEKNKRLVNELNVFPVPDGDTGTNMSLTIATAASGMRGKTYPSISAAADAASSLLLRGARGNSGVILSLLFRGMSKALKGADAADCGQLAEALSVGADTAYSAVMKPAEGTILTVSRVVADAAIAAAPDCPSLERLFELMLAAGEPALADTTEQNPVLKKAGVVDAGAKGFLIILGGMLRALRGEVEDVDVFAAVSDSSAFAAFDTEDITFAFDTVFIVRKTGGLSIEPFKAYLDGIGDSLVIGEDDAVFKVHVHTNTPGEALTEAQKYGTLELAKIENMRTQHEELTNGGRVQSTDDLEQDEPSSPASGEPEKEYGVVAVCSGEGLTSLFRELGADETVTGGQTMNPSTEDILSAVERVPARTVFVFPNNKNIIMAAQQCRDLTGKNVVVIPSKTVPQGIAALACFDPSLPLED
ncbi:MAG: DAK2 domain-containing protein, partial [Oscillospiraceae bacterium]|nr:DAK2 domain-containing protein [Oscillospiraceae bacterium]